MKILFSVLKYQLITRELINIGILYHNLDTDERKLVCIKRWSRVKNFDDEINVKFLKILTDGINEEIQTNIFNFNETIEFNIMQYITKFNNELRFSKVIENDTDDFENFIELTNLNFLRYDYDKSERPSKEAQIKYMKNLMKAKNINYSCKPINGYHEENINFDYIVDNYAFKIFTFENKNLNNLITISKSWAYTANELKDRYITVFVYDSDIDNKKFKIIIDILSKSNCKIMKHETALDFISNINNNKITNL